MNSAHAHLVLNHAPLFALLFGLVGLAYALVRRSDDATRLGLWLLVLGGILAVPTYYTGEWGHEIVERMPAVSHDLIHEHEEAGEIAAIAVGVLGLIALGGLFGFRRRPAPRSFAFVAVALALGATGWVGYTANLGGQIHHPEARDGFVVPEEDHGDRSSEREHSESDEHED